MCYTMYLYHFYVISLVSRFTFGWTDGLPHAVAVAGQVLLMVPAIVAVTGAFFVAFERPFMSWRPWLRRAELPAPVLAAPKLG